MTDCKLQPLRKLLAEILGTALSPATIWRWTSKGVKAGESRVKLHAVRVGVKLYSTREDVQRFIAEQNPAPAEPEQAERSPAMQRQLERAGLL